MRADRGLVELYSTPFPLPGAVRIHEVVFVPWVSGVEPESGKVAEDLDGQINQALSNMEALLKRAGASKDNVGRVTALVTSVADCDRFYQPWDLFYPDPQDRPAAKVLVTDHPRAHRVELEVVAISGGRRRRFDIAGVNARDPTVKIGNWVFSSRLHGTDPGTGAVPADPESQCRCAFQNMKTLIELAGGNTGNIFQISTFGNDASYVPTAEKTFAVFFPNPDERPALNHVRAYVRPHLALMVEMIAFLPQPG